jgi:hypothetical protein
MKYLIILLAVLVTVSGCVTQIDRNEKIAQYCANPKTSHLCEDAIKENEVLRAKNYSDTQTAAQYDTYVDKLLDQTSLWDQYEISFKNFAVAKPGNARLKEHPDGKLNPELSSPPQTDKQTPGDDNPGDDNPGDNNPGQCPPGNNTNDRSDHGKGDHSAGNGRGHDQGRGHGSRGKK